MANHGTTHMANSMATPALPELSGRLRDYRFPDRVEWLRKHSLAGFIGTGHAEINDAFAAILDNDVSGQQTDGRLASIREHARRTAPVGEEQARVARTITRITSNRGAYARQADRDKRWLRSMRSQVTESVENGERYASLAEYVGAVGLLPYEGPGQLTRYIDAARYVLGAPLSDGRFTFGAQLDKNSSGQSVVVDAFTARSPIPTMEQYQREVLGGVAMDVALPLLGYAIGNEIRRDRFWERDLYQASREEIARPVANAALRSLSA